MKQRFLSILALVLIGTASLFPASAFAACNKPKFFGLSPWYQHLELDESANCAVAQSNFADDQMIATVWKIILTILSDLFFVAGVLAVVYLIYTGIIFITSAGDPGAVTKAKRALVGTLTGLVIVLLAQVVVNTILSLITK